MPVVLWAKSEEHRGHMRQLAGGVGSATWLLSRLCGWNSDAWPERSWPGTADKDSTTGTPALGTHRACSTSLSFS